MGAFITNPCVVLLDHARLAHGVKLLQARGHAAELQDAIAKKNQPVF
jgi:hypothetical protein